MCRVRCLTLYRYRIGLNFLLWDFLGVQMWGKPLHLTVMPTYSIKLSAEGSPLIDLFYLLPLLFAEERRSDIRHLLESSQVCKH